MLILLHYKIIFYLGFVVNVCACFFFLLGVVNLIMYSLKNHLSESSVCHLLVVDNLSWMRLVEIISKISMKKRSMVLVTYDRLNKLMAPLQTDTTVNWLQRDRGNRSSHPECKSFLLSKDSLQTFGIIAWLVWART